jgi:hypothetical protein
MTFAHSYVPKRKSHHTKCISHILTHTDTQRNKFTHKNSTGDTQTQIYTQKQHSTLMLKYTRTQNAQSHTHSNKDIQMHTYIHTRTSSIRTHSHTIAHKHKATQHTQPHTHDVAVSPSLTHSLINTLIAHTPSSKLLLVDS